MLVVSTSIYSTLALRIGEQWAQDNLLPNDKLDYLRECNYIEHGSGENMIEEIAQELRSASEYLKIHGVECKLFRHMKDYDPAQSKIEIRTKDKSYYYINKSPIDAAKVFLESKD